MSALAYVATLVLVPMLVNELTDWLPWVASRLIRAAARLLPSDLRKRYIEEWQAELDTLPGGNLSRLLVACRIFTGAPGTRAAIRGIPSVTSRACRSALERAVAGLALIILVPLLAGIVIAIRISDGGPALLRQTRSGKDGRAFTTYRFRTMVVDAEQRKAEPPSLFVDDGRLYRILPDPRITIVGGWLRRWSADELPQLINVLRGDITITRSGPRPRR